MCVAARESLAKVSMLAKLLSLMMTLRAHHTFATLSSNNPRAKGKTRCTTWRRSLTECTNGTRRTANVAKTVKARFRNRVVLARVKVVDEEGVSKGANKVKGR